MLNFWKLILPPQFKTRSGTVLCLAFFLLLGHFMNAQNRALADSLETLYLSGNFDYKDQFGILKGLMIHHPNPDKVIQYGEELLEIAQAMDSSHFFVQVNLERGNALRLKGNLTEALSSYFQASQFALDYNLEDWQGKVNVAIADIYSIMGNHSNALAYYEDALLILRKLNDSLSIGTALMNMGDEFFNYGKLESALHNFQESKKIFQSLNYTAGIAYTLGNEGLVYAQQGNDLKAENNLQEAIQMLEELGDFYPISVYLTYMSDIYLDRRNTKRAQSYANQSLELARQYGLKDQISEAYLQLSEISEALNSPAQSLSYYKEHITYRDSVNSIVAVQEMADLRTSFEVSQKQAEVDLLTKDNEIFELRVKRQRLLTYGSLSLLVLVGLLGIGVFQRFKYAEKTSRIIQEEKNRSENLLLNILPEATAQELKEKGFVKARKIKSATVMFTDFVDFTMLAKNVDPELMVRSIDHYFKKFDEIITRYGLEKIKTIGDSYMCVGGLYSDKSDQAVEVIQAAKEILKVVDKVRLDRNELIQFEIRIGIHTGPLVAGIVGNKKWQFDVWGDTVNIASRMETNSVTGMINTSEITYNKIKDQFATKFRGEIEVKNRGPMKMYYIL
jgi:class 3 adenylate cyclase